MKVGEAVMAVYNYSTIYRYLHPQDTGPASIFRVILDRYVKGEITHSDPVKKFYSNTVEENANRICRTDVPLTYDECVQRWENQVKSGGSGWSAAAGSARTASSGAPDPSMTSVLQGLTHALSSMAGGARKRNIGGNNNNKAKKQRRPPFCLKFNTPGGCSSTRSGDGCIGQDGGQYRHGCNVRIQTNTPPFSKYCNAGDHNAAKHP